MRTTIILCLLFGFVCVHAQTTPAVSFDYDDDGNMTARYTVNLPGTRSSINDLNDEKAKQQQDAFSIMEGEQQITIYPNPTRGNITLEITILDSQQENFLRMYDTMGRLLQIVPIQSELTNLEIRGPAGMYFLDIHLGLHVSKWKIIKE